MIMMGKPYIRLSCKISYVQSEVQVYHIFRVILIILHILSGTILERNYFGVFIVYTFSWSTVSLSLARDLVSFLVSSNSFCSFSSCDKGTELLDNFWACFLEHNKMLLKP